MMTRDQISPSFTCASRQPTSVATVPPSLTELRESFARRRAASQLNASSAPAPSTLTARVGVLLYGVASYALFFITFLYAAAWVSGIGGFTPTALDAQPGPSDGPWYIAVAVNVLLLGVFAVQHSVMARPWFKRAWTRLVPTSAERSTYVLFSSLALIAMFWLWQPIGGVIWDVQTPLYRGAIYAAFAAGWLLVLVATFQINHFDLFGLRQVWLFFRGKEYTALPFKQPALYSVVRHPLYAGWFIGFWAAPTMTAAHLLFAAVTSIYILMAIRWEERDLMAAHPEYATYRQRVGMLIPRLKRRGNEA